MLNEDQDTVVTQETKKRNKRVEQPDDIVKSDLNECSVDDSKSLGIFKIDPENNFVVEFKTQDSACFDLAPYFKQGDRVKVFLANDDVVERKVTDQGLLIQHGERALIPTGLIFDIPQGYCMEIYARSGTSLKQGIVLNNSPAQIDSDYIHQTFISIANTGDSKYLVSHNPIAQAKLVKLVETKFVALAEAPKQKTDRIGGFGSTNK